MIHVRGVRARISSACDVGASDHVVAASTSKAQPRAVSFCPTLPNPPSSRWHGFIRTYGLLQPSETKTVISSSKGAVSGSDRQRKKMLKVLIPLQGARLSMVADPLIGAQPRLARAAPRSTRRSRRTDLRLLEEGRRLGKKVPPRSRIAELKRAILASQTMRRRCSAALEGAADAGIRRYCVTTVIDRSRDHAARSIRRGSTRTRSIGKNFPTASMCSADASESRIWTLCITSR